jgi:quercetin dioxygenase-like cupin family protein
MRNTLLSHVTIGSITAVLGAGAMYVALAGWPQVLSPSQAHAQAPAATGVKQIDLMKVTMEDVMGRVVTVRRTERDPGNGSDPHRHPGSHTFGYILEGTYEFRLNDGPVQTLKPGDTFYESPNSLHAVSRNASKTQPVKYLVIQVSDPTKPATVIEKK